MKAKNTNPIQFALAAEAKALRAFATHITKSAQTLRDEGAIATEKHRARTLISAAARLADAAHIMRDGNTLTDPAKSLAQWKEQA